MSSVRNEVTGRPGQPKPPGERTRAAGGVVTSQQVSAARLGRWVTPASAKKQADFKLHAMIYLLVNGFLVVIWLMTGTPFFWPIFPIYAWGIGVAANWWDAYLRAVPTQVEIDREIARLHSRGAAPE